MKFLFSIFFILISLLANAQLTAAQYKLKSLDANSENGDFGTAFYGSDKIVFSSSRKNGISNKHQQGLTQIIRVKDQRS